MKKTNAMRIIDQMGVKYNTISYDIDDGRIDGISVAEKIGKELKYVYKTLVVQAPSKSIYVFLLPVAEELDFKKAAKLAGEKSLELIPVKDIVKHTGYIRGGCSPIGMKKNYKTFIDIDSTEIEDIVISAGKIGVQMELSSIKLIEILDAKNEDFIKG